jgi:predicted ATP-grasp superfamily ATP-dependent carboligase
MVEKINVLIFPCGKENALELYQSLRYNVNVKVFGASSVTDHGVLAYENYIGGVPFISSPDFIPAFNKVITDNSIDVLIPTHDTVSLFFAEHRQEFACRVLCPSVRDALICREKRRTYELFQDTDFVPRTFESEAVHSFPVFVKPNRGEGSKNSALCTTRNELDAHLNAGADLLVCEYLPGEELTVDCFTNFRQELLFVGPRLRNRVQMGISFNTSSVPLTDEIRGIAAVVNSRLSFSGLWYFQLKRDTSGKYKLLEVSCRASGTMALYRVAGVNFGLLSVYNALGREVAILKNDFEVTLDRCLKNRYVLGLQFETVYIDYDDTLVLDDRVNDVAVQFLYQMVNKRKRLVLITRHHGDLLRHMELHKIAPNLFDEIHHISEDQRKSDFIKEPNAIFIDNAYSERESVLLRSGVPVFDVDAIESLLS